MPLKSTPFRIILILAIISGACNLPLVQAAGSPTPFAQETLAPTAAPAPVSVATPGAEPEFEDQITGLMDNYKRRLAAGEWTEEQGLIKTLQYVAGEAGNAQINPSDQQIISSEGSGIVRAAAAYINQGPDSATRAELQGLLDRIFPDTATLERLSVPAPKSSLPGSASLVRLQTQDINCATIWTEGFPSGVTATCFQYRSVEVGSGTYRLFIPVDMSAADGRMIQADGIMESLPIAVNTFLEYGSMPSADLVFTQLPDNQVSDAQAATWMRTPGGRCMVAIFPPFGEIASQEIANQVIAHELFHCFQYENYYAKTILYGSGSDWWVEGTAEFFGNVAYPHVNAEYEYLNSFARQSAVASLVKIDYPSFVFFQYLANQRGEASVIQLISQMPESPGIPAQLEALAGYPDIANLFHQFGRAYIDREIQDTGGGNLPLGVYIPNQIRMTASNDHPIPVGDFVLERSLLIFPEDTNHTLSENYDSSLTVAARPRGGSENTWADMPENVQACEERQIIWLGTSARGDGSEQTYTLSDEVEDRDVECDRCLVGRWRLNNASLWSAFENLMDSSSSGMLRPTLHSFVGEALVTFTGDGLGSVDYNGYTIKYSQSINNGIEGGMLAEATVNIEGQGNFVWYSVDNTSLVLPFVLSQPVYTSTMILSASDGTSREVPAETPPIVVPSPGSYQCTAATLLIDNGGFVEPIQYDRLSP